MRIVTNIASHFYLITLLFLSGTNIAYGEIYKSDEALSQTIYLVHSDDDISNNKFYTALIKELRSHFTPSKIKVISTSNSPLAQLDHQLSGHNKCIISIDSHSLAKVLSTRTHTPIFSTLSSQIDLDNQIKKYRQFGVTLSGIYQEQSFARQLMLAKAIDSKLDTAIVILGRKSRYSLNNYQASAAKLNMHLSYIILKRNGSPHNFLSNLSSNSNFLVTINDQHHYSSPNLQALLITSYETKTPIIGNKQEDTLTAAMASVYTPFDQLALETIGELQEYCNSSRSQKGKANPLFEAHHSNNFSVSINQQIAAHLNYPSLAEDLLTQQLIDKEYTKRK